MSCTPNGLTQCGCALAGVRADKEREVKQGYDGTWVAHPDLVPTAREVFETGLGGAANQLGKQRPDVSVSAADLLDLPATPGHIIETLDALCARLCGDRRGR